MNRQKQHDTPKKELILILGVALAVVVLMVLVVLTVVMNSAASGTLYSDPPFALSSLISGEADDTTTASLDEYVVPAFIGIADVPEGMGISAGDNVLTELYRMLSVCLAHGFSGDGEPVDSGEWAALCGSDGTVYIRYHSALPVMVLQGAAAAVCNAEEVSGDAANQAVRELFILLPDEPYGSCQVVAKTIGGDVLRFTCDPKEEYPTLAEARAFTDSFYGSFYRYELGHPAAGDSEPVFLERIRVRNILMTSGTAIMMMENRQDHMERTLRLFGFNPDKLNTHAEADDTPVAVESHGVIRIQADRIAYTAAAEGGISLQEIVGYKEEYTFFDTLRGACTIVQEIREMHRYYMGGDADVILTEVSLENGQVRLEFRYVFDNLLLENCAPALVMQAVDDRILMTEISAIAARSQGEFNTCYLESGIFSETGEPGAVYTDVTMTYPVDYTVNSIFPVWTFYKETNSRN